MTSPSWTASRKLGALAFAAVLAACRSAPWVCTPATCVSVATEDLPAGIRGRWQAQDGTLLEVVDYFLGTVGGGVVPKAASIVLQSPEGARRRAHITSFDGRVVVGEEYLGAELLPPQESPRRFLRLDLAGDRLELSTLRFEALAAAAASDNVRLIEFEGAQAVVYTDVQEMAAIMVPLLGDPTAWGPPATLARE